MAEHNELGKWGESIAMRYLDAKGYQLIEHDWRSRHKDIDIVARDEAGITVFVEVKTRSAEYMRDNVLTAEKRWNIARIVNTYMRSHQVFRARVDLIVIIGTPTNYRVEHIQSVMNPTLTQVYHKRKRPWT